MTARAFALVFAGLVLGGAAPARAAAPALTTVAETSGWKRTGRYAEVEKLCADFPRRYPKRVRCVRWGVTPEGRPMVALVMGEHGRPTVLLQGGIHAGEIDGKDAGFWLLRDLLDGKVVDKKALDAITVVFVPVFNVDGHERFGKHNRPNQTGPEEMGWRTTAQNFNLNRDYVKADAPEMHAMLRLLNEWDPLVYVDLHVTDGAQFQHDVAVLVAPSDPNLKQPTALTSAGRALRDGVIAALNERHHLPLGEFYPSFDREDDPKAGVGLGGYSPRFSQVYWSARNRLGVLVETHSWKDYATRVRTTYDVCAAIVRLLGEHGREWTQAAHEADAESFAGREVALTFREDAKKTRVIDFLGYAYTRTPSPVSGKIRIRYDVTKPEVWKVPFRDTLLPAVTVTAPAAGYLVPPAWAPLVSEKLAVHGVRFTRLTKPFDGTVEAFRATEVAIAPRTFEGHNGATIKGAWKNERQQFGAGGLFVPIAQARARLAMELLEPQAGDSLAAWGYFNTSFEPKEFMDDYVTEAVAEEMLQDPAVKAEFEQRLKSDAAFAKSPRERLNFFYRRHPSWDERLNLLPIFRVATSPR